MIACFAAWRVLTCSFAALTEERVTEVATTKGRRDKRRGTDARYVVVVFGVFARRTGSRSAAQGAYTLISKAFYRAILLFSGQKV
ncbi:hypothetical protein [Ruegeria sp. HKCCD8929]|uniref:hypothetical protein n=1 Tax=Ruegeria sp. HKCCD8929 TaxID=2683006 RepID=UPI001487688B|nr:hypothetical protein [Ruegeria sp. HKCCD8929]